jgi:hypothetical protein
MKLQNPISSEELVSFKSATDGQKHHFLVNTLKLIRLSKLETGLNLIKSFISNNENMNIKEMIYASLHTRTFSLSTKIIL